MYSFFIIAVAHICSHGPGAHSKCVFSHILTAALNTHNCCIGLSASSTWLAITVLWRGRVGWEQEASHRPLISNDLGSRGLGVCAAVWSWADTAGSVKSSTPRPLGQKQHSFSGSNSSITLPSTSDLVTAQKNCCVTQYQTDKHLDNLQGQCQHTVTASSPGDSIFSLNNKF